MRATAVAAALCLAAAAAAASPPSEALRLRSIDLAYSLDFDAAEAAIRDAIVRDPDDPANYLAQASIVWVRMLFQRGALTVDEYLGPPSLSDVSRTPPPARRSAELRAALARATSLAEQRLAKNPDDVSALYAVGAAAGRDAAYTATEEGRLMRAFWTARRAYDAHQRVLELDPARTDAGLIVGTYRYLVATLSRVMRWIAYLAGFGGDKDRAYRLLEACTTAPNETAIEARFALIITYSRDGRHDDALRELRVLRGRYPRNRLLWLETGATLLRAARPAEALGWLDEGLAALASDHRPRSFGEDAWWHYKRGVALVRLGRVADAHRAAETASAAAAYTWVRGRILTLSGQIDDVSGRRDAALRAYRRAREIGRSTRDALGVQEAERGIDKPFSGTSPGPARQYQ
jgi:tetratricopeptide (TPR) repeat protein